MGAANLNIGATYWVRHNQVEDDKLESQPALQQLTAALKAQHVGEAQLQHIGQAVRPRLLGKGTKESAVNTAPQAAPSVIHPRRK